MELWRARQGTDFVLLRKALEKLELADPRKAEVVKLRFLSGLRYGEIAGHLRVSEKTAQAGFYFARAWLRREIEKSSEKGQQ